MKLPSPFRGMKAIKELVIGAEAHARRLGDTSTGAEHLLLAALDAPDGGARRVFARIGVEPEAFGAAIEESHASALRTLGIAPMSPELRSGSSKAPKLNESAAHVLRSAASLSEQDRFKSLGAQVAGAVAEMHHGTAARALQVMGIDRAELAAAADAEMQLAAREAPPR